MLKRLIEVALPLKEISEQSAREKSIRHGHISTLHIWWARRPLAACRAVVFASLIPDPDDPECPASFRELLSEVLRPTAEKCADGAAGKWNDDHRAEIEAGTVRGKQRKDFVDQYVGRVLVLEFIKDLVKWENSNKPEIIEPARKLIAAAHRFLHPDSADEMPKVLDPFAGGGAIPLEALRLGCEAHAIDLNPVAHLIELCTLVYPQKYGRPNSRPTPDYIKALVAAHRSEASEREPELAFDDGPASTLPSEIDGIALSRLPLITEAEYQKNPLAADVKFWGHWVLERARAVLGDLYPADEDGKVPAAYIWARTVTCPNPACRVAIPLVRQSWLCSKPKRKTAFEMQPDPQSGACTFVVREGNAIKFDPSVGTVLQGTATCPFCHQTAGPDHLRAQCRSGEMKQQMIAVVLLNSSRGNKHYRAASTTDTRIYESAEERLGKLVHASTDSLVPDEPISNRQPRVMWVTRYGIESWDKLFNSRQTLSLVELVGHVRGLGGQSLLRHDTNYALAVQTGVAFAVNKCADFASTLCRWGNDDEGVTGTFGRQALPMVWDYAESNPLQHRTGGLSWALEFPIGAIEHAALSSDAAATVRQGDARRLAYHDGELAAVITDPPYYDAVPYADLSDYFYVWLKRSIGVSYSELFRSPTVPKRQEIIEERPHVTVKNRKDREFYEKGMAEAFTEAGRVLRDDGIAAVMFAHKTTSAWETLIAALIRAGLMVTGSWPLRTESPGRLISHGTASLASSVTLACRKRKERAGVGYWDDVRDELQRYSRERLDFFWKQGIRGADFFISAIGPALSVFGRYARVTRLSGEEVTVGQFLDEVRQIVTDYALSQILHGVKTGQIDPETRFHVLWKWSYGDAKVPADEAFKLAQALGIPTETMWDKTGVLEKAGENVQALPIAKRMRIKDLGDLKVDGSPASVIDVLHRCCGYRDRGDTAGLAEFLARSGHAKNERLWTVAQAISEVLPDGDKEKQLLQGLLNQRERVEKDMATLFTM